MKIMIIGHSVEDFIQYEDRFENKPGGIFYSASGFTFLKDEEDEALLCTAVDKRKMELFSFVYDKINGKYFDYVDAIPTIHLNIVPGAERHEKYENITDRINLKYSPDENPDGIFINMITGFDINLDDLKKLRNTFKAPIYLDLHSMCRGVGEGYKRHFRPIPDFRSWAENVNIIQCNENEIFTAGTKPTEYGIAEEILSFGPEYVIVTKGGLGVRLYHKTEKGIGSRFIPACNVEAVNKVGCGDVFGAGFFYSYIKTGNVINSLRYGNAAAGVLSTYKDLSRLANIKNDIFTRYN